ncbi:MAG: MobC family plasmid mobilization relaxosome protein [Oscillospiraceae bacterium]|nr:MobC family plasmid mobilization relaxosome protein [Oscillospiraceae bacterium]
MKKTNLLLSNIANNINQIAKHFNTGGLRSQAVTAELEKALDAAFKFISMWQRWLIRCIGNV